MNKFFYLLASSFWLLCVGCSSTAEKPPRPEGANIEISRPKSSARIIAGTDVLIRSGRVPLLSIRDGETRYGTLEPGTYHLTASSPDPYRFSDFSTQTWEAPPLDLVVEKGKFYQLELAPAASQGWVFRQVSAE